MNLYCGGGGGCQGATKEATTRRRVVRSFIHGTSPLHEPQVEPHHNKMQQPLYDKSLESGDEFTGCGHNRNQATTSSNESLYHLVRSATDHC